MMKNEIVEAGQGILRAAKGFALLGIAGKESTEQIVQAFVKVQGAYDILSGIFQSYRKVTTAIDLYRKGVLSAAAAEEALAKARQLSSAAGGLPGVAGAAGGAGGLGGLGGAGAGLAGGGVAVAGAGIAAALSVLAAGAMATNIGGVRDKTANRMVESGAVDPGTTAGWALSTGWRWGADKSGSELREEALAAEAKTKRMQEAADIGRQQAEAATLAERQRQAGLMQLGDVNRQRAFLGIDRDLAGRGLSGAELEAERARQRQAFGANELTGARAAAEGASTALSQFTATGMIGGKVATQAGAAELREKAAGSEMALVEAENRAVALAQQRLTAEQEISRERISTVDKSIAGAQQELAIRQAAVDAEKTRLMSAQERLAGMTDEQQAEFAEKVKGVRSAVEAGGTLTAEQFQFAQQWSGLREFEGIKEVQAEKRAGGLMAGLGLGKEEQSRMAQAQAGLVGDPKGEFFGKASTAIEATIKQQQDVRVKMEADEEAIVRKITEEVLRLQAEQAERIGRQVEERVKRGMKDQANKDAGKSRARNQSTM